MYGTARLRYPTRPGDLWEIGPHRLLCEDLCCLPRLPFPPVDVVYSDPPWEPAGYRRFARYAGREPEMPFAEFYAHLVDLLRLTCPTGLLMIWMSRSRWPDTAAIFLAHGAGQLGTVAVEWGVLWVGTFGRPKDWPIEFPAERVDMLTWGGRFARGRRALDPCCGVGTQLRGLLAGGAAEVYGVEMLGDKLANAVSSLARFTRQPAVRRRFE